MDLVTFLLVALGMLFSLQVLWPRPPQVFQNTSYAPPIYEYFKNIYRNSSKLLKILFLTLSFMKISIIYVAWSQLICILFERKRLGTQCTKSNVWSWFKYFNSVTQNHWIYMHFFFRFEKIILPLLLVFDLARQIRFTVSSPYVCIYRFPFLSTTFL